MRHAGHQHSKVYCRNFGWDLGQPASFEEKDAHPCAVEALLGALGGALSSGYATECARSGLEIDDIELTVHGKLSNILAHMGLEDSAPSFSDIKVKCFASTMDDENAAREAWERAVTRSPVAATLAKAMDTTFKFEDVLLTGDYTPLLPALTKMRVRQFVLEYATPRAGEIRVVTKAELALAHYRPGQLFLNTDCGFGCFANRCVNVEEVAAAKIRSIAQAARILRERHG